MKSELGFKNYGIHGRIKIFFLISILISILDQCIKFFAVKFSFDKLVLIPNFLWLTYIENKGAAFGLFAGKSYLLGLVNILIVLVIIYYNFKNKLKPVDYVPLAFIVGGAVGNAIDRLIFGSVIDFIDLGWFPIFNIADSFIVIGFIWLIVNEIIKSNKSKVKK